MIHFYYGNGKGKTSAAFGAAMRFARYGKSAVIQFLKDGTSGEAQFVNSISADKFVCFTAHRRHDFYFNLDEAERRELCAECIRNLDEAEKILADGAGLIVLDEAADCVELGIFDASVLTEFAARCSEKQCELIITGHSAISSLVDVADYCTEFISIKHPFANGAESRRGIEY